MAILQKLKSLLGLEDSGTTGQETREVGVTVERERSTGEPPSSPADATEEAAAADTNAAGSTDSIVQETDEPEEAAEPGEATGPTETDAAPTTEKTADQTADDLETEAIIDEAEPEAVEDDGADETEVESEPDEELESEKTEGDDLEDETGEDAADEDDDDAEPDSAEGDGEPVTVIKGIGPAYADRLADAGVETVDQLATADAEALSDQTDISDKRIQGWIDRAEVR